MLAKLAEHAYHQLNTETLRSRKDIQLAYVRGQQSQPAASAFALPLEFTHIKML
jgi:hypothetical protein